MADQDSSKKRALEIPQINVPNMRKPRCHSDTTIFNVRHSGQFLPTADLGADGIHLSVKPKKERSKTRSSFGSTDKALDFITKLKDDFSAKLHHGSPKSTPKAKDPSIETVSVCMQLFRSE